MMRVGSALLVAASVGALAGCGQLGATYTGMRPGRPRPIEQETIARYPPGTAQRAVLEWFRALQQNDADRASTYYVAAAGVTPNVIRFLRVAERRFFSAAQPPSIINVFSASGRATVFTLLHFRWSAPDGRSYVYVRAQAFELQLSGGRWQLTDNYFLKSVGYLLPEDPCQLC